MKKEGKHPFELRSPQIPTEASPQGPDEKRGKTPTVRRLEARKGVYLLGRNMLGRLVVAAIKHDLI